MMDRKVFSLPRLCLMIAAVAVSLQFASAARPEPAATGVNNPCSSLPSVCRYKWDPVERCCVADPRFDCYDICYSSAGKAASTSPPEAPSSCAVTEPGAPPPSEPAGIRYCCTPQQVSACSAQGGTTSCRTNVCQCLF